MPRINLLPWREAQRKELRTEFVIMLAIVALCSAVIWGLWHYYYVQLIEVQNSRIAYIESSIVVVDKKIEEIKQLEKEKEQLLARMRAIEELQSNRPLIVRLFDELVSILPEGITLTGITQKGNDITIDGLAQSNARVSSLMQQLESSDWLKKPNLKIIKESTVGGDRPTNSFSLDFNQDVPTATEEEE